MKLFLLDLVQDIRKIDNCDKMIFFLSCINEKG